VSFSFFVWLGLFDAVDYLVWQSQYSMRETLMSDGLSIGYSPRESLSALSFAATMRAAPAYVGLFAEYDRINDFLHSVFPAM
jgi:hypothetical protein